MAKEITVTINPDASVEVDLDGFAGKGCAAIIEGFAKAAGASSAGMIKKTEFNAPSIVKKTLNQ
jgi:hypothetical protein